MITVLGLDSNRIFPDGGQICYPVLKPSCHLWRRQKPVLVREHQVKMSFRETAYRWGNNMMRYYNQRLTV
jgi:hypothetical protein